MRITITLFILIFLFTGCSDNKKKESKVISAPVEDNIVIVEEKISSTTSSSLVDLSKEKNIQSLLCQGWIMDDDMEVLQSNEDAQGVFPVRCFYLFDDLTYTRNVRNFMEYGKWAYNDESKTFALKSSDGSKDEYKIAAIGPGDMIVLNNENNSSTKLTFLASAKKNAIKKDDPYYIDNNRWRIKPNFSENDAQIKKRLKDCIHFYILFYRDNLERKATTISFYGFPTCIRWYSGGIYMVKEKDMEESWFECFYNEEQGMKAYHMMEKVILMKYTWSKGNSTWVKKNLEVLEQMYNNL